jgi:hypothetical protein
MNTIGAYGDLVTDLWSVADSSQSQLASLGKVSVCSVCQQAHGKVSRLAGEMDSVRSRTSTSVARLRNQKQKCRETSKRMRGGKLASSATNVITGARPLNLSTT